MIEGRGGVRTEEEEEEEADGEGVPNMSAIDEEEEESIKRRDEPR